MEHTHSVNHVLLSRGFYRRTIKVAGAIFFKRTGSGGVIDVASVGTCGEGLGGLGHGSVPNRSLLMMLVNRRDTKEVAPLVVLANIAATASPHSLLSP